MGVLAIRWEASIEHWSLQRSPSNKPLAALIFGVCVLLTHDAATPSSSPPTQQLRHRVSAAKNLTVFLLFHWLWDTVRPCQHFLQLPWSGTAAKVRIYSHFLPPPPQCFLIHFPPIDASVYAVVEWISTFQYIVIKYVYNYKNLREN